MLANECLNLGSIEFSKGLRACLQKVFKSKTQLEKMLKLKETNQLPKTPTKKSKNQHGEDGFFRSLQLPQEAEQERKEWSENCEKSKGVVMDLLCRGLQTTVSTRLRNADSLIATFTADAFSNLQTILQSRRNKEFLALGLKYHIFSAMVQIVDVVFDKQRFDGLVAQQHKAKSTLFCEEKLELELKTKSW